MIMNNKVYGSIAIKVKNDNFNADFNGLPRQSPIGEFCSSPNSLKYACRRYWIDRGEMVLSFKDYRLGDTKKEKNAILPMSLEQKYNSLFTPIERKGDNKTLGMDVLKNIHKAIDVRNFGIACAIPDYNFSVQGVAQLNMGVNKREFTTSYQLEVLSPFQSDPDGKNSTIGSRTVVDEAHYFYNLTVNPANFKRFKNYVGEYTEEDYFKLKQGLMKGVTNLDTLSKIDCYNELGVFVKLKEGSDKAIINLSSLIKYEYVENGLDIIDFYNLKDLLTAISEEIEDVEIIYNPYELELVNVPTSARLINIYTI